MKNYFWGCRLKRMTMIPAWTGLKLISLVKPSYTGKGRDVCLWSVAVHLQWRRDLGMAHLGSLTSSKFAQPVQYPAFLLFALFGPSSHVCESSKGKVWGMLCVRSAQVHSLFILRKPETLECKQGGRGKEGLIRQSGLIFSFNIACNLVFWLYTKQQLYFLEFSSTNTAAN